MRNLILALKRYKLKNVESKGEACPSGNPFNKRP